MVRYSVKHSDSLIIASLCNISAITENWHASRHSHCRHAGNVPCILYISSYNSQSTYCHEAEE